MDKGHSSQLTRETAGRETGGTRTKVSQHDGGTEQTDLNAAGQGHGLGTQATVDKRVC